MQTLLHVQMYSFMNDCLLKLDWIRQTILQIELV